jgi:hypothetical protein
MRRDPAKLYGDGQRRNKAQLMHSAKLFILGEGRNYIVEYQEFLDGGSFASKVAAMRPPQS